jgi:hypothetical protein
MDSPFRLLMQALRKLVLNTNPPCLKSPQVTRPSADLQMDPDHCLPVGSCAGRLTGHRPGDRRLGTKRGLGCMADVDSACKCLCTFCSGCLRGGQSLGFERQSTSRVEGGAAKMVVAAAGSGRGGIVHERVPVFWAAGRLAAAPRSARGDRPGPTSCGRTFWAALGLGVRNCGL